MQCRHLFYDPTMSPLAPIEIGDNGSPCPRAHGSFTESAKVLRVARQVRRTIDRAAAIGDEIMATLTGGAVLALDRFADELALRAPQFARSTR